MTSICSVFILSCNCLFQIFFVTIKATNVLAIKNKAAIADELITPNILLVWSGNKVIILIFSLNQEKNTKESLKYCFTQI